MTWAWGPTSLYRPSREGPGGVQLGLSKHREPAFGSNRLKFRLWGGRVPPSSFYSGERTSLRLTGSYSSQLSLFPFRC